MPYQNVATKNSPAYIIYAVDISGSMAAPMKSGISRIEAVNRAIRSGIELMVQRSIKGNIISPRYRVAILAYSDSVYDVLGGFKPITEVAKNEVPAFKPQSTTNTAACFKRIKDLILNEITATPDDIKKDLPPPLVIHITDAEFFEIQEDFVPVMKEIQSIAVPDGNVLIEHIYISDQIQEQSVALESWVGYSAGDITRSRFLDKLISCSSVIPESYRYSLSREQRVSLKQGAVMLFPGSSVEFITVGATTLPNSPMTQDEGFGKNEGTRDQDGSVWDGWILGGSITEKNEPDKEKEHKLKTTLAYPKLFSKRFTSTVLVYIYPNSNSRKVNASVTKEIKSLGKSKTDYIRVDSPITIELDKLVLVRIESPGVEFKSPVIKRVKEKVTEIKFLAIPSDTCQTGNHVAKLSICDKESEEELFSLLFEIRVVDFVFDHVSRPFVYNLAATFSGLGAMLMFILTLLGQIDTTFGLTSGTTAGLFAATLYLRFTSLFQRLHDAPLNS